ncbi:HlyD family type I secretion periplasmic adaptor subunit [Novosphingobium lentum]|uniref:HlyD family type I secretion periplasmic adaptor subunit n=1 Tax=Novosphingobium lentum TaxID=145287 RepID=UPI00082D508F|nr:HlyD family type I secretion periplasmic adaptor subunit [Novosphingobium lentum]
MKLPAAIAHPASALSANWQGEARIAPGMPLRRTLGVSIGLLAVLLGLAAFVPIGGAVIATGQVGVESRVKRVAHPTGGVIAAIAVANGDHVEKGALLMRLDDRVTGADAAYSSLTVEQLLAQRARLEAERLGHRTIDFPTELRTSTTASAAKAIAEESQQFANRNAEQSQLRAQLDARVVQYGEQIRGMEAQIASLQRQHALIGPERQGVRELWDKNLVTIAQMNQLERTAADIEGNIASLQAQIAQVRARITESREQAIQLGQTRQVDAGAELAKVNASLNEQSLRSISASDQNDRSTIRAPYAGTVEKIAFSAIGEVIRPAEPIMEIVPDHESMVVEAAVALKDIDQVRRGQTAHVRFSAFNRAATPEIAGTVAYVATDRSENAETHAAFYTVRIAIDQLTLKREGLNLRSGMPAEVYIETGNRSVLSYIIKPLRDQFVRAFRDR